MIRRTILLGLAVALAPSLAAQGPRPAGHLNPLITLHEQGLPMFGLYAPSDRDGASPTQRAEQTLSYPWSDYVFDGSMERSVDGGFQAFREYVDALRAAGASPRTHPLVVKTPRIGGAPEAATRNIGRQLAAGASVVALVGVESAAEVRAGLTAMRFRSRGGTRADDVGDAPNYWGLSEAEYRRRADLWPLAPDGELVNWTIVESLEGLRNVRQIAAVEGVGVLFPGAGTLRRVFSTTGPDGDRVLDEEAWERAIQSVLAACKEFDVPCGYPATESDIEERMRQGFSVFVIGWGERGFRTVEIGRRLAGR